MPVQVAKWDSARDAWMDEGRISLFSELSDAFLGTFPTSGMTVNGVAYELPTWGGAMDGSGSSSLPESALLMTPIASEGLKPSNTMGVARRQTTGQVFLTNQIVTLVGLDPSEKLLKTPTSQLAVNGGSQHPDKRRAGGHGPTLADEIEHLLPTPTVGMMLGGSETRSGARNGEKLLPGVAKDLALLPTPVAQPSGNTPQDHLRKKPGRKIVTDLAIITENNLLPTGGRMHPPSDAGNEPSDGELPGQLNLLDAITDTA